MASRSLGVLTLDLVAKIGGFEQGMDRAARKANQRMGEIEKRALAFGKVLGTALVTGAAAAATALAAITKQAIDYADHLNDLNQRLGISAEALSGWAYAAQQTGTDIDALGLGLKRLAKNMAEALDPKSQQASLFKALGVDVKDAQGNLRSLEEILPEIAGKFKELDNATTEAALAQELFGKSGTDLVEFLNQGEDGLEAMRQKARDLGVELGDSTLKAADEFNDRLSDLKSLALGVGLQLAEKLLPELNNLVAQFTDAATEGSKTQKFIEDLATSISGISKVVVFATEQFAVMVNQLAALRTVAEGVIGLDWGKISQGFKQGLAGQQQSGQNLLNLVGGGQKSGKSAVPAGLVMEMDITLGAPLSPNEKKALEAAVNGALGGGGGKGGAKPKRSGKSDAEKEAESLARAYENTNDRLKEQIALFGQDGEAAQLRYELEHGALSKLDPLKKAELLQRAETLDMKREELDLEKKLDAEHDEREKRAQSVLEGIREERDSLGLSSEQWELYNNIKAAGVNASDENIKAITAETQALQEQRKALEPQIAIMDEFRNQLSDTVVDVIEGNKSIKDGFKDLIDDLEHMILEWIAKRLIGRAFGGQGTTGAGTGWGGMISGFLGGLFGGGRAAGGMVTAGAMYRVNENWNRGPEILSMGNQDYLMMGSQGGRVSPAGSMGAGVTVNQTFVNPQMNDPRSESQRQQQAAQALRVASLRNS